jgi:steroid delta-isomerase-like uncharacterized protein
MSADSALIEARLRRVEEHVAFENQHDLDGVMGTFSPAARYEDTPWGERHNGLKAVRGYYETLVAAMPDLEIEIQDRYPAGQLVILECVIKGTHLGAWRGLPPTGRRLEFPLCAIYTFDDGDLLAGERIYYDRATVLRQLGVLHDPGSMAGRISTAITHPVTLAKAITRPLRAKARQRGGRTERTTRG